MKSIPRYPLIKYSWYNKIKYLTYKLKKGSHYSIMNNVIQFLIEVLE